MEERAMRLCASACLRKPFDEETLLGAIRTAMKSPSKENEEGNGIDRKGTS
jgi:FixJ family two-component response regulator